MSHPAWVLGTKLTSSGTAVPALNCCAISLDHIVFEVGSHYRAWQAWNLLYRSRVTLNLQPFSCPCLPSANITNMCAMPSFQTFKNIFGIGCQHDDYVRKTHMFSVCLLQHQVCMVPSRVNPSSISLRCHLQFYNLI